MHWADDATLDALRFLVRRIASLPAVLVLTYRDDELGRDHALHGLLGLVSRLDQVRRLPLARLSAGRSGRLSAGSAVDATGLYALTSGNPFFVHELLVSAHGDQVPPSIADAVLARVRPLDPGTQDVLEQLAVMPGRAGPVAGRGAAPASAGGHRGAGRGRTARPADRVGARGSRSSTS